MTYSGVGKVVPSMVAANTNASSQNATRRRAARGASAAQRLARGRPGRVVRAAVVVVAVSPGPGIGDGGTHVGLQFLFVCLGRLASLTPGGVSGRHTAG